MNGQVVENRAHAPPDRDAVHIKEGVGHGRAKVEV